MVFPCLVLALWGGMVPAHFVTSSACPCGIPSGTVFSYFASAALVYYSGGVCFVDWYSGVRIHEFIYRAVVRHAVDGRVDVPKATTTRPRATTTFDVERSCGQPAPNIARSIAMLSP